jgi:hypothetical protein
MKLFNLYFLTPGCDTYCAVSIKYIYAYADIGHSFKNEIQAY